ncbi:hypothetical protein PHSY_005531 [Pseudozyma hubeiensis SY62]|uniref:Uncharacterized protein n=1 Tax=Pseudozyma hubeiensis (strain SY62) TaxID=1305764 RepID=R9P982_PSEHS|nr:hypothetical protein PHSY_005531 [Pseudozyma hubeiensis SY62]GAC97943.1 hypothetical protein PHSY_005531 [Pseudozyma hubeiensis SY62]
MRFLHIFRSFAVTIILYSWSMMNSLAISDVLQEIASSLFAGREGGLYQLEASPMGPYQTKHYAKVLQARVKDLGLSTRRYVQGFMVPYDDTGHLDWIRKELNRNHQRERLVYLDQTPHKRKVHALLLDSASSTSPNIAVVSTPHVWKSLDQKIQLHTFAQVPGLEDAEIHDRLNKDFNYVQLDSLARNAFQKRLNRSLTIC